MPSTNPKWAPVRWVYDLLTPFTPRETPRDAPASGVFDSPGVSVCINRDWIPHLLGWLEAGTQWDAWTAPTWQHGYDETQRLISALGAMQSGMITNIRVNGCALEVQYCGSPDWVNVGDLSSCAPDVSGIVAGLYSPVALTIPPGSEAFISFTMEANSRSPQTIPARDYLTLSESGSYHLTGRVRVAGEGRAIVQLIQVNGGFSESTLAVDDDYIFPGLYQGLHVSHSGYLTRSAQGSTIKLKVVNTSASDLTVFGGSYQTGELSIQSTQGRTGPQGPAGPPGAATGPDAPYGGIVPPGLPDDLVNVLPPATDQLCNAAQYVAQQLVDLVHQVIEDALTITLEDFLVGILAIGGFQRSLIKQLWDYVIASNNPDLPQIVTDNQATLANIVYCSGFQREEIMSQIDASALPDAAKGAYKGALSATDDSRLALWVAVGAYVSSPNACTACPAEYQLIILDGAYFDTVRVTDDESLLLCTPYWRHSLGGKWLQEFEAKDDVSGFYVLSGSWPPVFVVGYLPFGGSTWIWEQPPPDLRLEQIRWYWNSDVSIHTPVEDIELPLTFDELRVWLHVRKHV